MFVTRCVAMAGWLAGTRSNHSGSKNTLQKNRQDITLLYQACFVSKRWNEETCEKTNEWATLNAASLFVLIYERVSMDLLFSPLGKNQQQHL